MQFSSNEGMSEDAPILDCESEIDLSRDKFELSRDN